MRKNFKTKKGLALRYSKGFTLIELLVVIAIIALLATVAVVALTSARTKARDTKRVGDLKQLQNALALFADNNKANEYPLVTDTNDFQIGSNWIDSSCGGTTIDPNDDFLKELITTSPQLMASTPDDPSTTQRNDQKKCYLYYRDPGNSKNYYLLALPEKFDPKKCTGTNAPPAAYNDYYCVQP